MHEPQRLLTRLNPITIDWQNAIAVTGEVLRAEDIAACLSGLAQGPYLLALYLWSGDVSVLGSLYALLLDETKLIAQQQNWQCKDNDTRLLALIKMALHEMKKVNICKPCKGTGIQLNATCYQCNGIGRRKRKYSEYAKHCGVKVSNWKKCWDVKYYQVQLILQDWEYKSMEHLLARL